MQFKNSIFFSNGKKKLVLKTQEEIQRIAIEVIAEEKKAVESLAQHIDNSFSDAVETIFSASGRVILTGIGKSANIATKVVSTLNSTGTPALFMHAADAIHGDLGMIRPDDVVVCISKSGNTPEIKILIPLVKNFGNKLIAIVGNTDSFLAREADIVLDTTVQHEACPNNLAPTSSTTAQLVMGDALAIALMACRNFTARDFARFHPGGALGKQLYMRVSDLYRQNEKPQVAPDTPVRETILEMTSRRLGCAVVVTPAQQGLAVQGIVTDGDLRRMIKANTSFDQLTAADIMTRNPKTVGLEAKISDIQKTMNQYKIHNVLVVDEEHRLLGIVDRYECVL